MKVICGIDSCIYKKDGQCTADTIVINPIKRGIVASNIQTYCQTFEWNLQFNINTKVNIKNNNTSNVEVN